MTTKNGPRSKASKSKTALKAVPVPQDEETADNGTPVDKTKEEPKQEPKDEAPPKPQPRFAREGDLEDLREAQGRAAQLTGQLGQLRASYLAQENALIGQLGKAAEERDRLLRKTLRRAGVKENEISRAQLKIDTGEVTVR